MRYYLFIAILLITGCASVQTKQEWEDVFTFTKERVGAEIQWEQSEEDRRLIDEKVKVLLSDGLTMDDAVKIALLNNKKLQATFEDIGIAKGDLVQAGFFTNPNLKALFKFPFSGGSTGLELGGIINIADLWQIPIRKKVAASRLQRTMLQISDEIINTTLEAKRDYINYVALSLIRDEMEKIKDQMDELRDHLIYRKEFGYATELDIYTAEALVLEASLEFSKIESDLLISRFRLNRILGLSPEKVDYEIRGVLSEDIIKPPDYEYVLSAALSNRPDIQIARIHIEEARNVLALEKSRIFSDVQAGAIYEKDIDREESIGAEIGLQLPIFHQNQAQIAIAEFRLRQAEKSLKAKVDEIKEEILVILERIAFLSQKINIIKDQILPARKEALEFARKYFNAMELNMLYLIEAQKRYLESRRDYLMTLKEYYEEMIRLERVIGDMIVK